MLNYSENCVHSSQDVFFYILITITFSCAQWLQRWLPSSCSSCKIRKGLTRTSYIYHLSRDLRSVFREFRSDRLSFTTNFTDKLAGQYSVSENSSTMVSLVWWWWTLLATMIIISFNSKQFSLDYFRNTQRPGNLGLTTLKSGLLWFSYLLFKNVLLDIIRGASDGEMG